MLLLKCCTQYVSKFGKLSSGQRTGKSQFSFQSQRKAMPKNAQGTIQLCSFHMLARLCSESFKLDFRSMWTENFQIHKLGFEEAEEPEIKLPTFVGSWRKQGSSRKTATSVSLTMQKPLKRWECETTLPAFGEICMWVKKQQWHLDHGATVWFQTGRGVNKAVYCHAAYLTSMQCTSCEMPGWINHKLESRFLGEIPTTSDMQLMPL